MPRINVTDEELVALERIRNKHREVTGWNAAIAQVEVLWDTGHLWSDTGVRIDPDLVKAIGANIAKLRKELPL